MLNTADWRGPAPPGRRRGVEVKMGSAALLLSTVLAGACATPPEQRPVPVPVEDHSQPPRLPHSAAPIPLPPPAAESGMPGHESAPAATDPAVVALMSEADERMERGQSEYAAAALERALRLAPEDPLLWHRLARVRLDQKQWRQAIALAGKSDALSASNPRLRAANRRLIARAKEMLEKQD